MEEKEREIREIVEKSEKELHYHFDDGEIADVLRYTLRKCEINGKGDDYVPILFETELHDYVMRSAINAVGYMNFLKKGCGCYV